MSPKKDNWLKMKHWFNWNDFSFFSFLFCLLWLLHTLLFILSRAALQILSTCFDSLSQDWLHPNSIWMISNIIISHQYIINTAVHYSFWMILHRFHSANVTNEVFRQSGFAARDLAGRLTVAARNFFWQLWFSGGIVPMKGHCSLIAVTEERCCLWFYDVTIVGSAQTHLHISMAKRKTLIHDFEDGVSRQPSKKVPRSKNRKEQIIPLGKFEFWQQISPRKFAAQVGSELLVFSWLVI